MAEIDFKKLKLQKKLAAGKTTIGIDIGTSSINIAQMAKYKGKPTLIKTAIVCIEKKVDEDKGQTTLKALNKALSNFNTKNAKLACVVNCPQTCVRKVITPYMPKDELKGAVGLEVKQSIPFPFEEAVLDFNVIEDVRDKGVEKLSVIVAASPKETIAQLLSYFIKKKAKPFTGAISKKFEGKELENPLGIKLSGLLPMSLCIENIIEKSNLKMSETLVAVEIGTVVTELNIFKNSRLQFSRKIPFSGQDITKSLTGALMTEQGKVELTLEEAEQIKRKYGVPRVEDNQIVDGKITTNHILSLVRPKVEQLANEIERSFDFYREEMHGDKIDRIVLFGGGAQLKGLDEFLSKELELEVNLANPLEDIDILDDEVVENAMDAHKLVLAIGAASSSMKGINLLPVETKGESNSSVQKVALSSGVFSVAILLLVAYGVIKNKEMSLNKSYQLDNAELMQLMPQLQQLKEKKKIDQLLARRPSWSAALKEISHIVPVNMYLMDMDLNDNSLSLKGVIEHGEVSPENLISQFMVNLERGIFNNVKLIKIEKKEDKLSALHFEIKCQVNIK